MNVRGSAVLAVTASLVLAGCSSGDDAPANAAPTATASPTPTAPTAVVLRPQVQAISIADDDVLTKRTGRQAMDNIAITEVSNRLIDLLQRDLDARNLGETGELSGLAADLGDQAVAAQDVIATLGSPANPASEVDAILRLGVDVTPRWAEAELDVLHADGTHSQVTVVIALDEDAWHLVLVAQGEVA